MCTLLNNNKINMKKDLIIYPFTEGQKYFTIEDNYILESVWDCQSKEFHDSNKMYFETLKEAYYFYKYSRNAEMLDAAIDYIRFSKSKDSHHFLEGFEYFNDEPKIFLI